MTQTTPRLSRSGVARQRRQCRRAASRYGEESPSGHADDSDKRTREAKPYNRIFKTVKYVKYVLIVSKELLY